MPLQLPDVPTPFASDTSEPALRWGIVGTGFIAGPFVNAMRRFTRQIPTAVASRDLARAQQFAQAHEIEAAYGSYQDLIQSDDIDVVYIALAPSEHLPVGLHAIAAGKHVLIEKPLATSAAEGAALVEAARAADVLLMEAMWTRYLPQSEVIRRLLADGGLGELRGVLADHGQAIPVDRSHRLYRPELGGGALFDIGIYTVQLDSMILGEPSTVTAVGTMTDTGVDADSTLVLTHKEQASSTLVNSMTVKTPTTAAVLGTTARLEFGPDFYNPTSLTLRSTDRNIEPARWHDRSGRTGFDALSWQANALAQYVSAGLQESPVHSLHETVSILATMDDALQQIRTVSRRHALAAASTGV